MFQQGVYKTFCSVKHKIFKQLKRNIEQHRLTNALKVRLQLQRRLEAKLPASKPTLASSPWGLQWSGVKRGAVL